MIRDHSSRQKNPCSSGPSVAKFVSTFNGKKGFNYAKAQTRQSGSLGHRAGGGHLAVDVDEAPYEKAGIVDDGSG